MLPDGALSINSPLALMRAQADRRRPPELILADEEQAALLLLFISGVARRLVSLQEKIQQRDGKQAERLFQPSWLMIPINNWLLWIRLVQNASCFWPNKIKSVD